MLILLKCYWKKAFARLFSHILLFQRVVKAVNAFVHGIVHLSLGCLFGFCCLLLGGSLCLFLGIGSSLLGAVFRLFSGFFGTFLCLINRLLALSGHFF